MSSSTPKPQCIPNILPRYLVLLSKPIHPVISFRPPSCPLLRPSTPPTLPSLTPPSATASSERTTLQSLRPGLFNNNRDTEPFFLLLSPSVSSSSTLYPPRCLQAPLSAFRVPANNNNGMVLAFLLLLASTSSTLHTPRCQQATRSDSMNTLESIINMPFHPWLPVHPTSAMLNNQHDKLATSVTGAPSSTTDSNSAKLLASDDTPSRTAATPSILAAATAAAVAAPAPTAMAYWGADEEMEDWDEDESSEEDEDEEMQDEDEDESDDEEEVDYPEDEEDGSAGEDEDDDDDDDDDEMEDEEGGSSGEDEEDEEEDEDEEMADDADDEFSEEDGNVGDGMEDDDEDKSDEMREFNNEYKYDNLGGGLGDLMADLMGEFMFAGSGLGDCGACGNQLSLR
ncbi:hypothetical protein P154DRAFT_539554 [Amniculicola lignicola CBS 123094]|uniref:Uncharacterized protein n=1 Tax=Amniculicola lignicola CBS 123094 TaxID=1392246 RepID=A0A6A5WA31_9PLEO|nr:hypothetical protein P154DRAFT_539554 [Amniculicola lignicola CBS 123094]